MNKVKRFRLSLFICLLSIAMLLPGFALANEVPSVPANLEATALSSSQIELTWDPVSGATSYSVYRASSTSGTYAEVAAVSTNSYSDAGLLASTPYYYKVKALNGSQSSGLQEIPASATTSVPTGVPNSPGNLNAEALSYSEIELTWDPVIDAEGYSVYRATSAEGTYSEIAQSIKETSYRNTGLSADHHYFYKVRARNREGTSEYSSEVSAKTLAPPSVPAVPANLTAAASNSNTINLEWDEANGATTYYVYQATSSSGTYAKVATVTNPSYSDTGLLAATTYYYKVRAYNVSGLSNYSSIASAKTLNPTGVPATPVNLDADDLRANAIGLTWSPAKDATAYYVYRATSSSGSYSRIATVKTTSYTDSALTSNETYYYKVRAYNSYGLSDYSLRAYATATPLPGIPNEPYNLKVNAQSSSEIDLNWASIVNATSYYVYRATSESGTYRKVATVYSNYYTDNGLSGNTRYYYKVRAHNSYGTSDDSALAYAVTYYGGSSTSFINRLAGQNRYESAARIAEEGWESSYYAVLASGEDFPDALCGAPLAGKYNAPILLTSRNVLESKTKYALSNLDVKRVFLIGGTGVISSAVEDKIEDMGIRVIRIGGRNRYETSVKVAERMGYQNQAVIATGENFPDALSIAPIAAMKGLPILLTAKDQLSGDVKAYLRDYIKSTVVVGGTGVISRTVYDQLPSPKRLSGSDRYKTNLTIIKAYDNELNFNTTYMATGEDFPDALAGSALAALNTSPVILVGNTVNELTKDFLDEQTIDDILAFGGSGAISDRVLRSLESTISGSSNEWSPNLSAPRSLSATAVGSNEIYLDWSSVADASTYYVYRATSYSGTYTKIATVSTSYYFDVNLSENKTYYYKVRAHNAAGTSDYSSRVYATTNSGVALEAPTNLRATPLSSSEIILTWDEVDNATSYYLYRATSSDGTYTKIATVDNEYYIDTHLISEKTYYYKVRAHNSSDTSSYSAKAYATTD